MYSFSKSASIACGVSKRIHSRGKVVGSMSVRSEKGGEQKKKAGIWQIACSRRTRDVYVVHVDNVAYMHVGNIAHAQVDSAAHLHVLPLGHDAQRRTAQTRLRNGATHNHQLGESAETRTQSAYKAKALWRLLVRPLRLRVAEDVANVYVDEVAYVCADDVAYGAQSTSATPPRAHASTPARRAWPIPRQTSCHISCARRT
ncbi:hypothetical protein C8J57DRAFT_523925 [Mycena rebaudengoi]|nr:hypothetical protein C8J57DRAFT_523925 [Mycena rebaudengoi]